MAQRPQDFLTFCHNEALLFFTHCPVHKDVMLGSIVQSVLTLFGFWLANIVMNWGVAFFGDSDLTDPATLPILIIALSIFGLMMMPLGNTWSRWREVKADTYAQPRGLCQRHDLPGRCRSTRLGRVSAAQPSLN